MPQQTLEIALSPEQAQSSKAQIKAAARKLNVPPKRIQDIRVLKSSIDARKHPVRFRLQVLVALDEELPAPEAVTFSYSTLKNDARSILIIGCGPAGLFAALHCLKLGFKPIILERGKDASSRRFDLAPILREGRVVEDSNYCFGEGGAGTFSDGKLYTRATKRGPIDDIYRTFVAHGAPPEILIEAHPHIGSNLLPKVVMGIRETIRSHGGEVHFGAKVTGFLRKGGQLQGVTTEDGRSFTGRAVILATGHSARDIYSLLHEEKIRMENKPFAVGVRIEHPQPVIDATQYHLSKDEKRSDFLPAARYRLATKIEGRGVHSFCMCPGGFIVPAATENDEVVVNGMSLSKRDSPFANSGIVVGIEPEDLQKLAGNQPLPGIHFQKKLEQLAKQSANGNEPFGQLAPAQRALDFLNRKKSESLPETSYFPGVVPARLDELLPGSISKRLARGLKLFGRQMKNYLIKDALLIGFETRTSSPVRIPRDPESLEHPEVPGLYPCGEGAGFAGGIVSAALDGIRCADAAIKVNIS
ncbi:MAG: NAD(P)/FAD-dependent oxidoreductase [Chthoniobacterales bacterium]